MGHHNYDDQARTAGANVETDLKQTVKSLVNFVNLPETNPNVDLAAALSEVGRLRLRIVAIKLLFWLKLQWKLGKPLPLNLNDRYQWCRDLVNLVEKRGVLADVVTIRGGTVVLSSGLPADEREEILALADAGYQPRLMKRVTERRSGS